MRNYIRIATALLLSILLAFSAGCSAGEKKETSKANKTTETVTLTVSAAASLQDALQDIQKQYNKKHSNVELTFNFGSSGALQQQIEQGAPVDLFFSAAEDKFKTLVDKGIIDQKEGTNVLGNELVFIVPKDSSVKNIQELQGADIKKVALGTPEAVPAGKYAKQSLTKLGLWSDAEKKAVYTKDVRQVLTYVETKNVEAGMVYKTDAQISDKVKIAETLPADSHDSIVYPLGIIKSTKHKAEALAFYEYLQTKEALRVFEKYGFVILK
ncbi:molybdate ABC transporter substrate-binding protein [Ectobacillus panaciterrae]|uniref:molybdate ABC transporter substrate-binding protein n=1 Tax=Ectobacillus panaciterrae TaxID=363872 RepID=UPI0003FAB775|nr:molybdate ABC transporter substrate-binding protein [Ectobacillus panaciterrae]